MTRYLCMLLSVCVCARARVCVCVCVCKVTLPEKVCGVTKCVTPLFFSSSPVLLHLFSIPSSPYVLSAFSSPSSADLTQLCDVNEDRTYVTERVERLISTYEALQKELQERLSLLELRLKSWEHFPVEEATQV